MRTGNPVFMKRPSLFSVCTTAGAGTVFIGNDLGMTAKVFLFVALKPTPPIRKLAVAPPAIRIKDFLLTGWADCALAPEPDAEDSMMLTGARRTN